MAGVVERLQQTPSQPDQITADQLRDEGTTTVNTTGERSKIAELVLDVPNRLLSGRTNPFDVVVPAFEKLGPTDGTQNNDETFNLSHDVIQSPNGQNVIVWLDGSYVGQPKSVDYANNTITVNDAGTNSNVYVWYIPAEAATLEVYKAIPSGKTSSNERLYTNQLRRLHQQNQDEQPSYFELTNWEPYLSSDMKLQVYLDAPYTVRFEDPDGNGATPTNMRLDIPVERAQNTVPGLKRTIKAAMGR